MSTLGQNAVIRMGVTLRGRDATRPDPRGSCRMIRISDLSEYGELVNPELHQFEPDGDINTELFLRPGDVLLPNRGTRTTAHVFRLEATNVLVGAQFFIIRPDAARLVPEYLAWYLRSEEAVQYFHSWRKGTLVPTLQRKDIEDLPLPMPPLPKQRLIAEVEALAHQERDLIARLKVLRSFLLEKRLLRAAAAQA